MLIKKESLSSRLGEQALPKLIPDYKNRFSLNDMDLAMRQFILTYDGFDGELDDEYDDLCRDIINGTIESELYYDLRTFVNAFCEVHRTLLNIREKYTHANMASTKDGAESAVLGFVDDVIKHGL